MACHTKVISMKLKPEEESLKSNQTFGPKFDTKLDELKGEIISKIDKELSDSKNAREFISQKYDELCSKIHSLTELDATVTGFRGDVRAIERQLIDLASRVTEIEGKVAYIKETPSIML